MKSLLIFFLVSIHVDGGKIDTMEKKIEKILEKQDILKESIKELKVGIYDSIKSITLVRALFCMFQYCKITVWLLIKSDLTKIIFIFRNQRKTGCQNWWHRWGYKQCHGRHGFSRSMNLSAMII